MKKIAVMGCGVAAVPILKKAKEMGVETHCFALEETQQAKGLADYFYSIDFHDIQAVSLKCREIKVDGVIATSEITTEATAYVADELGLLGNRVRDGFAGNNKYLMRERVKEVEGVYQPTYSIYDPEKETSYPVFIKAIDACGKKGISLVHNQDELNEAIVYSKSSSQRQVVLTEEYIKGGIEYSVEGLSYRNKHYVIQITRKDSSGAPHFAEMGHHQPGEREKQKVQLIKEAVPKILSTVGIYNGMSHTELKIVNDKVFFIEVGARAGGDRIADTLVGLSTSYDYYRGAISAAIDEFVEPEVTTTNYAGIYFLCEQTKGLLPLFECAKSKDWCVECKIPDGALVRKDTNDDGNTSGYLVYCSDHKINLCDSELKAERINEIEGAFELIYQFNRKIGREISDEELIPGIHKFIDKGNVIVIMYRKEIIAFLNVYCNDVGTGEAYINNVEVYEPFRGYGLSNLLLEKALITVRENQFDYIALHVNVSNKIAISLYEKYGFKRTGETKEVNGDLQIKMKKVLG